MTAVVWDEAALRDLFDLADHYEALQPALGEEMVGRVQVAAARLSDYPHLGRGFPDSDARIWLVKRTPFLLIYRPLSTEIRILHVRHAATDRKSR